jgi:hypothetical protein
MFAFAALNAPPVGAQSLRVNRKSRMALWAAENHNRSAKQRTAQHTHAHHATPPLSMGISGK